MVATTVDFQSFPDGRLDTANAAKYTGLSEKTLAVHRSKGTGPAFIKRGRVFYFQQDLDAWLLQGGKVVSTKQDQIKKAAWASNSSN